MNLNHCAVNTGDIIFWRAAIFVAVATISRLREKSSSLYLDEASALADVLQVTPYEDTCFSRWRIHKYAQCAVGFRKDYRVTLALGAVLT